MPTFFFLSRFIQINSLSFSTDDMYLVSSSSTETVHVFRLVDPPQEKCVENKLGGKFRPLELLYLTSVGPLRSTRAG